MKEELRKLATVSAGLGANINIENDMDTLISELERVVDIAAERIARQCVCAPSGMLGGTWAVGVEQPSMAREWFSQFGGRDRALLNIDDAPASVEKDYEYGITTLTFSDGSAVVIGSEVMFFERDKK